MISKKVCPICGSLVKGRSDKKFCSIKCKSIFQYESRQKHEELFFKIDRQLKTNRKLLKYYNKSGYTTLNKALLIAKGFNPKFFTHYWKNSKGDVYLFCYDFGFLSIKKNNKVKYLIVQWQDYMN